MGLSISRSNGTHCNDLLFHRVSPEAPETLDPQERRDPLYVTEKQSSESKYSQQLTWLTTPSTRFLL